MGWTNRGILKIAAKKIGISFDEYIINVKNGLKWCTGCKAWHNYTEFGLDSSRTDGLDASCLKYRKIVYKKTYKPKPRISRKGTWVATTRDGDEKQARSRVNILVRIGLLPNPNDLPCSRCKGNKKAKRNEYHHHNGYGVEYHEDVIVLCSKCHGEENDKSKETHCKNGHEFTAENTYIKKNGNRSCTECRRIYDRTKRKRPKGYWKKVNVKRRNKIGEFQ